MNCEFANPVNYLGETPSNSNQSFQFEEMACQPELYTFVENAETSATFYLDKTFSYGDIFISAILTIFLLFGIFKFLWNFIQQNWNYKI